MKWTTLTLDLSKIRKLIQTVLGACKTFLSLIVGTVVFFVVLGLGIYLKHNEGGSTNASMKGLATAVSSGFFLDMMGMEIPQLAGKKTETTFSQANVFSFLFRMVTDLNPHDPKTLLAREVPGLGANQAYLLRPGTGTGPSDSPQDYTSTTGLGTGGGSSVAPGGNSASPSPIVDPTPPPAQSPQPNIPTTGGKKVVMIYHSHNRESYLPEIGEKDPAKAYDEKKNVTLVGKRLQAQLEDHGIGAVQYDTDYPSIVKDFNYAFSYKYSGKTVKEAMATNPDLTFLLDLHRDDQPRSKTTTTIDGKDYAQVFFIIGKKNKDWERNEAFAAKIQASLDQKIPGLSKGIWGKGEKQGDAEYNQSLSPNSVLIEIGGPYNTLEECYRTVDALAPILAELYWDATKVSAPAGAVK